MSALLHQRAAGRRHDVHAVRLGSRHRDWRFNLPTGYFGADNVIASTVFDRTLLRAGETVHMKHFLRRHVEQGLVRAARSSQQACSSSTKAAASSTNCR
jgi:hypothetical protein